MKFMIAVAILVLLAGCMRFTDQNGNPMDVVRTGNGALAFSGPAVVTGQTLHADVKGSIYETGEQVSVFGTCLNGSYGPVAGGTTAALNVWYPNGTMFFQNVSMTELQPGYYLYSGSMSAVQGTYLTELLCAVNGTGEVAKAWGEWQNPFWVAKINDSYALLLQVNQSLMGIGGSLTGIYGNLSGQITGGFTNVSVLINDSLVNISGQLQQQQNLTIGGLQNISSQYDVVIGYLVALCYGNGTLVEISFVNVSLPQCNMLGGVQANLSALEAKLDLLISMVGNLSQQVGNVSVQIGNLSVNMTQSFEITWQNQNNTDVLITNTYNNLSQQITVVGQIANASVDRNDSYLASLLWKLINGTGTPVTHNLTVVLYPDTPVYGKNWYMTAQVINEYNVTIGFPTVSCFVSTTNAPATVNQLMTPSSSSGNPHTPNLNSYFWWSERIQTLYDFNWTVNCVYN